MAFGQCQITAASLCFSLFRVISFIWLSLVHPHFREISRGKLAVPEGMFCLMPKRILIPIHFQGERWDGLRAYECNARSLLSRLPHLSASKPAGVCPVPSGAIPRAEIPNLVQARQKGCELWDLCQLLWPWISS